MSEKQMALLGEANGVKWYWAQPGEFEAPGVYYWDGERNVLVQPAARAEPVASMLVDHVNALHPYRAIPMVNVNLPDGVHMLYTAPVAAQPSEPVGNQRVLALAEQVGLAYRDCGLWYCSIDERYDITDELLAFAELVKQGKV